MIDTINIKNLTTGSSISLYKSPGHEYLLETSGIDWGSAGAEHNKYSNLTGVGDIITSTKILSRTIAITGRICSPHTNKQIAQLYEISRLSDINAKKVEEINYSKKILSQLINPLDKIRISCGDFNIDGKPNSSVVFSSDWESNNEVYCKFTFSMFCESPLFRYKQASLTPLQGVYRGFHFPLAIPSGVGIHFGEIIAYQLVSVKNSGDIPVGGTIVIEATGTATNPVFTNVYTQESMAVRKTLSEGEVIKIDTIARKITGATDGVNFSNYFQYWDFNNDWLQFSVGNTLLGYSADDESYKNLNVWVELNEGFYSMEDQ